MTLDDEVAGLDAVHVGPADGGHGGRLLFVHGMFGGVWVWKRMLDVADVTRAAAALDHPSLIGHSLGGLLVLKVAEQTNPPAVVALTPAAMLRGRVFLPSRRTMNRLAFNRLDPAGRERVWRRIVPESGRQALGVAVPGLAVVPQRLAGVRRARESSLSR